MSILEREQLRWLRMQQIPPLQLRTRTWPQTGRTVNDVISGTFCTCWFLKYTGCLSQNLTFLDGLPDSFIWLADAKNHIIDGPPCSSLLNDNEAVAGGGAGKCSGGTIDHVLTTKSPTRSTSTSSTQSLFVSEDEVKSRMMLIKLSFLRLSVVLSFAGAMEISSSTPLEITISNLIGWKKCIEGLNFHCNSVRRYAGKWKQT